MKKLEVFFSSHPEQHRRVGTLAEADRKIYFEYDPEFLREPLWLSPFKLPPRPGLLEHRDLSFGPLFGLFDDSLPDGWGLLLMDRGFRKRDLLLENVSPLDRLAYMGSRTMGALTYRPPNAPLSASTDELNLHDLAGEAYRVLEGNASELLPQLMLVGGSPGGARPKILIGLKGDHILSGADTLPTDYESWIVKFPSNREAQEEGRIEFAYSKMAKAAGVEMQETRLFPTSQAEAFFGIKRFDRNHNQRFHMHTFGNLIHSNFRVPGCDYEQLLNITRVLTKNQHDVHAAFRLMVFNVLAHNRDDHVKNVAFIFTSQNEWRLSPAYDLTFSQGPGGEHSMTIAGEGRAPSEAHMLNVAASGGISSKEAHKIIDEVKSAISKWPLFAEEAGLPFKTVKRIQTELQ